MNFKTFLDRQLLESRLPIYFPVNLFVYKHLPWCRVCVFGLIYIFGILLKNLSFWMRMWLNKNNQMMICFSEHYIFVAIYDCFFPRGIKISLFYVQISDQLKSRFSSGLSLPQLCENFVKAAYDPRVSGIYLHIEPLNCGWGKVEEIRRHILDFKKSGNLIMLKVLMRVHLDISLRANVFFVLNWLVIIFRLLDNLSPFSSFRHVVCRAHITGCF